MDRSARTGSPDQYATEVVLSVKVHAPLVGAGRDTPIRHAPTQHFRHSPDFDLG